MAITNPEGSSPRKGLLFTSEADKEACQSLEKVTSGTFSVSLGLTNRQSNNSDVTSETPSGTVLDF